MKKLFKIILALIIIIVAGVAAMAVFKICPPPGPWPTPPWCASKTYKAFVPETKYQGENLPGITPVINMMDTWGKNYNFLMFENTRNNIDSSFVRVAGLGAKEVYVNDFHRAVYGKSAGFASLDYKIEDDIFSNDFRDEAMTKEDLRKLAQSAHANNIKLGIKHNMSFVDIGKYLTKGGNIGSSVSQDFSDFNKEHSEEWIRDFFAKWQARMVEKAKIYKEAGVDIMSLTPTWMGPTFTGHEELADTLWRDLVAAVKQEFPGKIHIIVDRYGFFEGRNGNEDWEKYDYYKLADIVEFDFYNLPENYTAKDPNNIDDLKKSFSSYLNKLDERAKQKGVKLSIMFSPFSYKNSINEQKLVEYLDFVNEDVKKLESDWPAQAAVYQAFLQELNGRKNIERVISAGFWWDDAMDPSVKPRISLAPSIRNKNAEDVFKKWFAGK